MRRLFVLVKAGQGGQGLGPQVGNTLGRGRPNDIPAHAEVFGDGNIPQSRSLAPLNFWMLTLELGGKFVLSLAAYKLAGDRMTRFQYQPRGWHGPTAGLLSGVASGMFNTGGPPFNAYLLPQKLPPRSYVATSVVFFAAINLLKSPGFLIAGVLDVGLLASLGWVIVLVPPGLAAARRLILRVNQAAIEWMVVGLLFFSSVILFWQSL